MRTILRRYAFFVAGSTFFLIFAGGLVTSHDAGLSVPDWPTSYGMWFPPMAGNMIWEHSHRVIAAFVGILTAVLALWIQFTGQSKLLKSLGWGAFLSVFLQALLGGLTVIYLLPKPISIAHAALGQIFFCLTVLIAYFLSRPELIVKTAIPEITKWRKLLTYACALIFLQLLLGAIVRHAGQIVHLHILVGCVVLIFILILGHRIVKHADSGLLSPLSGLLTLLVIVQVFLGIGAFIFTFILAKHYTPPLPEILFTVLHQSLGAAVLALAVLMKVISHFEFEVPQEISA